MTDLDKLEEQSQREAHRGSRGSSTPVKSCSRSQGWYIMETGGSSPKYVLELKYTGMVHIQSRTSPAEDHYNHLKHP